MSDSNSDTIEYGSLSDDSDFDGFTEAGIQPPLRRAGSATARGSGADGIGTSGLASESDDSSGEEVCMLKYVDIYQVLYNTSARLNTVCFLVIIIRAYRSRSASQSVYPHPGLDAPGPMPPSLRYGRTVCDRGQFTIVPSRSY